MDLDILVNKEILRGDHGYITYVKRHNLRISIFLLIACLIVFTLGLALSNAFTIVLNLISVLLILPTAQFLARYFAVFRYRVLEKEKFDNLCEISDDFLVLGELPIVKGKKGYYTYTSVITKVGIYVLVDSDKDLISSRKKKLEIKQVLVSLVKPKGHNQEIYVYDDYDDLYKNLRQYVKSKSGNPDMKELGKIASAFISKTM